MIIPDDFITDFFDIDDQIIFICDNIDEFISNVDLYSSDFKLINTIIIYKSILQSLLDHKIYLHAQKQN